MSDSKICTKCNELKSLSEFYNNKNYKDGYQNQCKTCFKLSRINYRRTKNGVATIIYNAQKYRSKRRVHHQPSYTREVFKSWLFRQNNFRELFDNWVESGYDVLLKPSCDRLDDYKPYTLDNIQLMTWRENNKKGYEDRRNGINNKANKAVIQLTVDGLIIEKYCSIKKASMVSGVACSEICLCCKDRRKSAGGFVWCYQ